MFSRLRLLPALAAVTAAALLAAGCGSSKDSSGSSSASGTAASAPAKDAIVAVGAENEYANVISQIGGRYVKVSSVMSDPNTDPHTFEASPSVARTVSQAKLVVQNGVGYDDFMNKIESASDSDSRTVIEAAKLLGLPSDTANPHLWYDPKTMPAVAHALAVQLAKLDPAHAAVFRANEQRFDRSLRPWLNELHSFTKRYPGASVAVTEPVPDYMLDAGHIPDKTPFSMQADIMNGTDPAPQAVSNQHALLSGKKVSALLYNQQVTDSVTNGYLNAAKSAGVPVVGVYETMPPGYTYQTWMEAELRAIARAASDKRSTEKL